MCGKKKRLDLLFGHYVFYHNLTIQALNGCFDKLPKVRINGSSLNETNSEPTEDGDCSKKVCNVCEKPINSDSCLHDVFCHGFLMCKQKECDQLFENNNDLVRHLDFEHPINSCRFGCQEINLKHREVDEHLQKSHDIIECNLCNIISGSGNFKNHLRDKHSVNLMTYEKAISQTSSKLYRLEQSSRHKRQVLCNFCDCDLTQQIREFSFLSHYQNQHEITVTAILRNLDKNPIIDVVLNERKLKTDEECLKHFTVVVRKSTEELIEVDFDTSKVYCIGSDKHIMEQKTQTTSEDKSLSCEFCNKTTFDASCRLYEHMNVSHGFRLLNVNDQCDTCHVVPKSLPDCDQDDKSFNLSLVCPIDEICFVTKDNFKTHMAGEHLDKTLLMDIMIYKCFECNFAYNKMNDMRNHILKAHPDVKMSYCRICRYKLTNENENIIHFNLNHADDIKKVEMLCCSLCKKLFKGKNKAKIHYESQHRRKEEVKKSAFKCQFPLCSEAFGSKEDRKMHHMVCKL